MHLSTATRCHYSSEKGEWIGIPTNGNVNKAGLAVMGRGLALQAAQRFPSIRKEFGNALTENGNALNIFIDYRIITLPVKHNWYEEADLTLIELTAKNVYSLVANNFYLLPDFLLAIYTVRLGCGNGKRTWEEVKPILEKYWIDDRFILVNQI